MEKRKEAIRPSSPPPNPCSSSPLLRDISNYKTPKPSLQNPNSRLQSPFPIYFTASKTPFSVSSSNYSSSVTRRRSSVVPASKFKAARRLKAFELEQTQSSRKAQVRREKSIRCLSRSLSAWLNFLFQNPRSCGCDAVSWIGGTELSEPVTVNGKRESLDGGGLRIGGAWRSPKRQRESSWRSMSVSDAEGLAGFTSLQASMEQVCSIEDLKERMGAYLTRKNQTEVLSIMNQVTKNIDDGRLRMKAHCPIVTDVRLKEKATRILLCYNLTWLRIGLHMVFGGDSLLPMEEENIDQEELFLKMVIAKQLFFHPGLSKYYAYNKKVDGLFRPGYFEALGNVILKRFLLLVLLLDRAKCQSALPVKYGIDGIDGGSPLLFNFQSHIKSSRQLIQEFLSEVMHGEGDLLAHLVIVGYKVTYQQLPLAEYNFTIMDLFEDVRDGVRLCRAFQLLQCNASILSKLVVPSDTGKKNLVNCGIILKYLKQTGVSLSDKDGVLIVADDLALGEKELTLSLIWNMFVHLQVPLLINKVLLAEEISEVKGCDVDRSNIDYITHMEMLLEWIQGICKKYQVKVDSFASLVDGKALYCLVDYYFRNELPNLSYFKDAQIVEDSIFLSSDDNTPAIHNFTLVQKVVTTMGNFPEVLQMSDILEHGAACNERSVIVLLVFLSSLLISRKNMDQLNMFKVKGWSFRSPLKQPHKIPSSQTVFDGDYNKGSASLWSRRSGRGLMSQNLEKKHFLSSLIKLQRRWRNLLMIKNRTKSALIVQSHFRGWVARQEAHKMKHAIILIQAHFRGWSRRKPFQECKVAAIEIQRFARGHITRKRLLGSSSFRSCWYESGHLLQIEELKHFMSSVLKVQRWWKNVLSQRNRTKSAIIVQSHFRGWAVRKEDHRVRHSITLIQAHFRGWLMRKHFQHRVLSVIMIQKTFRCLKWRRAFQECNVAAIDIQGFVRGHIARKRLLGSASLRSCRYDIGNYFQNLELKHFLSSVLQLQRWWRNVLLQRNRTKSAIIVQSHFRGWAVRQDAHRVRYNIILIQAHFRGWWIRKKFQYRRIAVITIQKFFRCLKWRKAFQQCKVAAIEIQRIARGHIARKRVFGKPITPLDRNLERKGSLHFVLRLQRWWRRILLSKSRANSAVIIQSHIRGWIARREASRRRHWIVVIQSHMKGYFVRKESREQFSDLRFRVQKSAVNVDNNMRLMNRLIVALQELPRVKSVSSILHTCTTLDIATAHSQKCCETLVAAGAIGTLLKLIQSVNRSTPYQEVLKHTLSILRNLMRYQHLAGNLVNFPGCLETIFMELLRNKGDGYFIAVELLKRLCETMEGIAAIQKWPAFIKRLHNFVDHLEKRAAADKRNTRLTVAAKEYSDQRLRQAVELLNMLLIINR